MKSSIDILPSEPNILVKIIFKKQSFKVSVNCPKFRWQMKKYLFKKIY